MPRVAKSLDSLGPTWSNGKHATRQSSGIPTFRPCAPTMIHGPEPLDRFTPGADTFDLDASANWRSDLGFSQAGSYIGFGQAPRSVSLAGGKVLYNCGAGNDLGAGFGYAAPGGDGSTTGLPAIASTVAGVLNPSDGTAAPTGPMQLARFAHTLTLLPDGRVLAVGGKDLTKAQSVPGSGGTAWTWATTTTAEIYDPASNMWTPTGNLNSARAYHAAQVLPNGQVLIVGGYLSDLKGNVTWPNTTELYDPASGTFSVMDTLDYGISSPQLVMMNNGQVFVAGQYEPPMTPPTSQTQAQTSGIRAMDVSQPVSTITAGSDLFGTITPVLPLFQVKSVQFQSCIPVSYSYGTTTVQGPNWTYGVNVSDGDGSSMPAVYLVNGNNNSQNLMTVNLSIDEAWKGHTGTLVGTLQESSLASLGNPSLQFESVSTFSLNDTSATGLAIPMNITNLPSTMDWFRGDAQWKVVLDDKREFLLPGTTRLEVFVVWDTPSTIYTNTNGVWPEVLRVICRQSTANSVTSPQNSLANITSYLFNSAGLSYTGTAQYLTDPSGGPNVNYGGVFNLKSFLLNPRQVNCMDQTAGVQSFGGAIGIPTQWVYISPVGFIPGDAGWSSLVNIDVNGVPTPATYIVGSSTPINNTTAMNVIGWNDPARQTFAGHAFITSNGNAFDACVGPHLGTEVLGDQSYSSGYLLDSIDGYNPSDSHYNVLYVNVTGSFNGMHRFYDVPIVPGKIQPPPTPNGVTRVQ